jgi:hypothetical protein
VKSFVFGLAFKWNVLRRNAVGGGWQVMQEASDGDVE